MIGLKYWEGGDYHAIHFVAQNALKISHMIMGHAFLYAGYIQSYPLLTVFFKAF